MKPFLYSIFLLLLFANACASKPVYENPPVAHKPFPQHAVYTSGTIKPNHKDQTQLDADVVFAYQRWKKNYLTEDIGVKGQYYIKYQPTGAVTVSEAHGYGMVTIAYMAGQDKDAKAIFDGMFHFFKAHPSNGNPKLMNWQQGIKDGKVVSIGSSCATDGDLDIAYALLLADKQWGSKGAINYQAEALQLINAIKQSLLHTKLKTLKMGDWAGGEGKRSTDATRPSDFMLQHLKSFKKATGDPIWDEVTTNSVNIVNHIYENFSTNTGLLPDFSEYKDGQFIPAIGQLLEAPTDGSYSYNAGRTPWRLGTDLLTTGDTRLKKQLATLNTWIRKEASDDPAKIKSGYQLDGTMIQGRSYQDLTYQAPFMISAMIDSSNQAWLNKLWDNAVQNSKSYFGDSIAILCLITASGNWWIP
ncbi:MAG: beta-glucanase [Pedobacter sp.]|nr:MAG: beta-glucanase [Pedobacter sp.]